MKKTFWTWAVGAAAAVAAICLLCGMFGRLENASGREERQRAETALQRAVIACYAAEGHYPDSYEYLKQHYGLRIDEEKYFVHYSVFASNVMPDFAVIER